MNGLENFEPFDDLEEWSDNAELFMDAMAKPTEHVNAHGIRSITSDENKLSSLPPLILPKLREYYLTY